MPNGDVIQYSDLFRGYVLGSGVADDVPAEEAIDRAIHRSARQVRAEAESEKGTTFHFTLN